MAEKMHDTYNQKVTVEAEAEGHQTWKRSKQGVIFYIVEEVVNNARKHAQARTIGVRLKLGGRRSGCWKSRTTAWALMWPR